MGTYTGQASAFVGLPYIADDAAPQMELGTEMLGDNGRKYVYARAGATLVVGDLLQMVAQDTGDQDIAGTVQAAGTKLLVTAAMTVTANQYAGGYVTVTVTPGLSNTYRIARHAAYTSAAATFELEEELLVATTASTRLDFVPSPYNGVIQAISTLTGMPVGVAVKNITSGNYGWVQVHGAASMHNDAGGALTVGQAVMPSASVSGAMRLATAGNAVIGRAMSGIAASESGLVYLTMD